MNARRFTGIGYLLIRLGLALPLAAQNDVSDDCLPDLDYRDLAENHLEADEYTDAYDAYSCVIQLSPDDWEAVRARGSAAILAAAHEGNFEFNPRADYITVYENDSSLLNELVERDSRRLDEVSDDMDAYLRRGIARYVNFNRTGALEDFRAALNLDRHNAFASLLVGMVEQANGQTAKAGGHFREALELAPDNAGLYAQIGQLYLNNGAYDDTITYLTSAIDLDPEVGWFYFSRGYAYQQTNALEAARADYDQAIALEPGMIDYHINRGYVNQLLEDNEGIIADFSEVIRLDPEYAYAYQTRGWAYVDTQQYEAAIPDFDVAWELDPFERYTALGLGTAHTALGDLAEGAADYLDYVELTELTTNDVEVGVLEPGDPLPLDMNEGDVYYIPFSADEGDILSIDASAPRENVDPMIVLLSPDGVPLAGSDDTGNSLDATINDFEAPDTGTYTLIVTHAGGGSVGQIDVTVEIGLSA